MVPANRIITLPLAQTPEGYISKDIYILSYLQKGYFLSFFGAGYFEDIISYF
jgi:hypothetical protein